MDYQQTIEYLYNSLPMFQNVGEKAYKSGLHNIEALCAYLGNPERKLKTIHVAGTNGKGSTCHMLSAILQSAGYKTALFTSPHLKSFTERFRINGQEISQEYVVDFVARHKAFFEEIKPSFFEMNVALAFEYFQRNEVDIAVIETGLGGRLDSTNVLTPELSIITNISYDHQNILGNTLEAIAGEKAGIIKENVPVVISETQEEIKHVFERVAAEKNAQIVFADKFFTIKNIASVEGKLIMDVNCCAVEAYSRIESSLSGSYQKRNFPGVFMAVEVLQERGYNINKKDVVNGLAQVNKLTGLKGRWQRINDAPLTICDTGHNEDGIKHIVDQIKSTNHNQLYCIIGLTADKDTEKILCLFPTNAYYYFCNAKLPRAMDSETLALRAMEFGLEGEVVPDVNEALKLAMEKALPEDMIYIGGSTFVVAELNDI